MYYSDFTAALAAVIHERGVKKAALAKAVGVVPTTISAWLAGRNRPDLESVQAIARYLRLTPQEARALTLAYAGLDPIADGEAE